MVSGEVPVEVVADDDRAVTEVVLAVDGRQATTLSSAPWTWSWDTAGLVAGPYVLSATARDAAGNEATATVEVKVAGSCSDQGDCPPQSVRFITPVEGARVCGTLGVEATATDDLGIARLEFRVDGVPLGVAERSPYQVPWDTTQVSNGQHVIKVTAFDTTSQEAFDTVTVEVDNAGGSCDNLPNVNITNPLDMAYLNGTINVEAQAADDIGVLGVTFFIDNGRVAQDDAVPYKIEWNTDDFDEGAHTLKALATDTANQTAPHQIQVTVDRTPPTVTLVSPEPDALVTDTTVTLRAEAMDNFRVRTVEFLVDDESVAVLQAAPWEVSLPVSDLPSGTHRVGVIATDGAGFTATDSGSFVLNRHPNNGTNNGTNNGETPEYRFVLLGDISTDVAQGDTPGADIDAIAIERDGDVIAYAATVEDSNIGGVNNAYTDTNELLGAPDSGCRKQNFTALGGAPNDGFVIVSFENDENILSGDFIIVYELGATFCPDQPTWMDDHTDILIGISASRDGEGWVYIGTQETGSNALAVP